MAQDRTIFPIFDPGDLDKAVGRCQECNKELERLQIAFKPCSEHPSANAIVESPGSSIKTGIAKVNLKPLNFTAGEPETIAKEGIPDAETILAFCCGKVSPKPEKIVKRYQELHAGIRIQAVPSFDYIEKKIIVPLLQAQSSFMTGNFLATIALCGMVAEMLSNLSWELYQPYLRIGGKEVTPEMEKAIFGMEVETLTQQARLNVLLAVEIITPSTYEKFKKVKDTRNDYVHFHKANPSDKAQKEQAIEMFRLTQELVCDVIGQDFSNGRLNLKQAMFAYLQKLDLITPFPSTPESSTEDADQ